MANQPKIGGKIVLDGEKEYKNAITSINSEMKVLQSELKKTSSEFGSNQNSIQAIAAKNEVLNKQYETQKEKIETLQNALKNAVSNQDKIKQSTEQYKSALEEAEKEMDEMKNSSEATDEELEEQKKKIEELKNAVEKSETAYQSNQNNINKWQTSLNNAETELNNLENTIEDNTKVIEKMEDANVDNVEELEKLEQQVDDTTEATNTFSDVLKANIIGEAIVEGIKAVTSAVTDMTKAMISVGSNFEASMSQVAAVSGATGADFENLNDKAKEMGATTKFTASEAADAFNYMAMAGWKTQDMLGGIDGVLNLAAAGATDLGTTSDIVTDALTAFGESAEEAGRLADIMAAASSNANTNVEMMGETFKYVASVAGSMGYSMEDTAVDIGLMANSGIKASQAGTSLRSILSRMAAPTDAIANAMQKLDVSLTESDGSMKSLKELTGDLRTGFSKLSDAEKISVAANLAGKNAMSGLLAIVNAAPEDYEKLTEAVENSSGAAERMAEIMQDNLQGEMTKLQSATEGLGIAAYEKFGNVFKNSVSNVTSEVSKLTRQMETGKLGDKMEELAQGAGKVAEKAINLATDIIPVLIDGFNFIVSNGAEITSILEGIAAAMMIQKAVAVFQSAITSLQNMQTALNGVTAAQETANAAANANPYILLASVIAGVVVAVGRYAVKTAEANRENDEMYQKIKENKEAIEDLQGTIEENDKTYKDSISSIKANVDVLSDMKNELYELNEKEEKTVAEKTKMNAIIEKLNEAMPDLNLAIDEETEKLNLNKKAVEDNIEAMKKQAEEQAIQERYAGVIEEQISAKEQQATAELNLAEATEWYNNLLAKQQELREKIDNFSPNDRFSKEYNDILDEYKRSLEEIEKYKLNMKEAQEALDNASIAVSDADKKFESFDNTVQSMSMNEVSEDVSEVSTKTQELTTKLGELEEEYAEVFEEADKSIRGQIDLFSEFNNETTVSIEDLQKNLESNIEGMRNYRNNLTKLSKSCSEEFVSYLAELGMGASAEIEALANATPEQLKKYEDAWKTSQKEIGKTVEYSCKDIEEEVKETEKELEQSIKNDKKVKNAVKDAVDEMVVTGKEAAKKANEVGVQFAEGMSQGIKVGTAKIVTQAADAVKKAMEAAKKEQDSHSPSRKTNKEIGVPFVQGIEKGIESETPNLQNQIKKITKSMIYDAPVSKEASISNLQSKLKSIANVTVPKTQSTVQPYSTVSRQQVSASQIEDLIVNTVKAIDIPNAVAKAINNSGIKITYKDDVIGNIVAEQFIKEVYR